MFVVTIKSDGLTLLPVGRVMEPLTGVSVPLLPLPLPPIEDDVTAIDTQS